MHEVNTHKNFVRAGMRVHRDRWKVMKHGTGTYTHTQMQKLRIERARLPTKACKRTHVLRMCVYVCVRVVHTFSTAALHLSEQHPLSYVRSS